MFAFFGCRLAHYEKFPIFAPSIKFEQIWTTTQIPYISSTMLRKWETESTWLWTAATTPPASPSSTCATNLFRSPFRRTRWRNPVQVSRILWELIWDHKVFLLFGRSELLGLSNGEDRFVKYWVHIYHRTSVFLGWKKPEKTLSFIKNVSFFNV